MANPDSGYTRPIHHVEWNLNYVWNTGTLVWEPMLQPGGGPGGALTNAELRASPVPVTLGAEEPTVHIGTIPNVIVTDISNPINVLGPLTRAELDSDAVLVSTQNGSTAAKQDILLAELQLKADLTETQPVNESGLLVIPTSGLVSSSGNNTCITPTSGKKLRIFYLSYNPAAAVEAAFRFGAAGSLFYRTNVVTGGSVLSKDYGKRHIEGAVNESLILNLSGAVSTIWNANYIEV